MTAPTPEVHASVRLFHGSSLDVLPCLPDCSVDSIVTDPPYELGFMGKKWDSSGIAYSVELWRECLRVLKPGGHLLAFGGTRTYHRMAVAIEDAGFEIRDSIHWLYGSGFPKSLDVSKAIDKAAGAGATDAAKQWDGWGTGLKPAHEPIVVARKPLDGTVAANVLQHGTGALNIDGCRVVYQSDADKMSSGTFRPAYDDPTKTYDGTTGTVAFGGTAMRADRAKAELGRWPANVIIDDTIDDDWARYFYCAKPSRAERNAGLEQLNAKTAGEATDREDGSAGLNSPRAGAGRTGGSKNFHPTVKPIALMRYLIRLVTPPDGTVLDPFTGSGTTLVAATLEGADAIGIEMTSDYLPIIRGRVKWAAQQQTPLQP